MQSAINFVENSPILGPATRISSQVQVESVEHSPADFKECGFSFLRSHNLPPAFQASIAALSAHPENENSRDHLRQQCVPFLQEWMSQLAGFSFSHVVPVDSVLRHTDVTRSPFQPIYLAHVDFDQFDLGNMLSTFEETWGARHWPLPYSEITPDKIAGMVNVWISLNSLPSSNTLALLDTR